MSPWCFLSSAAYDLSNHSKVSHVDLVATERFDPPLRIVYHKPVFNKQLLGSSFKHKQAAIVAAIEGMSDDEKKGLDRALEETGTFDLILQGDTPSSSSSSSSRYQLTRQMVSFEETRKTIGERPFVPSVIEPSFGIGRILHCIMEHSFVSREIEGQEERVYMAFPALVAPTKVSLLPLSNNDQFNPLLQQLKRSCLNHQLTTKIDCSSASIGRRYARADELGVPFAITIDFLSLEDHQVTLRERDSMQQIRLSIDDVVSHVAKLCRDEISWRQLIQDHPLVSPSD